MTIARRIAIAQLTIWTLIFAGLLAAVLIPGINRFDAPENSTPRVIISALILVGLTANIGVLVHAGRARRHGDLDERDEAVARRASEATLVGLALLVYIGCIILYTVHRDAGVVPAAWLYVLAYSTVALVSLLHAAATLVVDITGQAHA